MSRALQRIGLATFQGKPEIQPDDRLLLEALDGCEVRIAPWDASDVRWQDCDAVLIRSCWDYHHREQEFVSWARGLETSGTLVLNTASTLAWNARKTYLRDVEEAGLATVPTIWLVGDDLEGYRRAIRDSGWKDVVLKPIVGASSFLTWLSSAEEAADRPDRLEQLTAQGGGMLQPFIPEIQTAGEWSVMFFGGEFSHAVRKRAGSGEFRVQEEFGGTVERAIPPDDVLAACLRSLEVAPDEPLYARIDGVETASGFLLTEVELIEPVLFLGHSEDGPVRFVRALIDRWLREVAV